MNRLSVFKDQSLVGVLWLDRNGRYVFQYDRGWLDRPKNFPISVSLPLRRETFERDLARPFFANLLPEGDIRRLLAAQFGISPGNDFKLLEAIGGDCAGALSLLPEKARPAEEGRYRPLPPQELDRLIDAMPLRPLLAAEEGVRLSLAGVQNKLPVHCREDLFLPEGGYASSYILKAPILHVQDSVLNEAFCMTLAGHMGLSVAPVFIRSTGKNPYCLVKRFDRVPGPDGRILRLHQEDFCQALGHMPDRKYESEGGPNFQDCFRLLERKSRRPAADKKALIRWAVFNFLIGNADAHGKNASLMISEEGVELAPFYDLLSTTVYRGLSPKMAMKIGGEYKREGIFRRHWERFAATAGVKPNFVFETIQEMSASLPDQAVELFSRFPEFFSGKAVILEILAKIREHSAALKGL